MIAPLRQVRQDWRANASQDAELAALREQVKKLELQAERILLDRLQALAENWPTEAGGDDWLIRLAGGNSAALQVLRGAAETLRRTPFTSISVT